MPEQSNDNIKIKILNSTYSFKCQPEEVEGLKQGGLYLDQKLRYTKARFQKNKNSTPPSLETTLLLSALEVCIELLEFKRSSQKERQEAQLIIQLLQEKIDHVLEKALYQTSEKDNVHALPPASQQK